MTLGATLVASALATLARPTTWVLALLGFLVRGGIVVLVAPIVVVPSAVGLANAVTPTITTMAFTGLSNGVVAMVATLVGVVVLWLVGGGLIAAAAEAEAVSEIAEDDELRSGGHGRVDHWAERGPALERRPRARWSRRIVVARSLAALPLVLALAAGAVRLVGVAYRELTVPSETVTPVVARIAQGAPEALIAILLGWMLAEIVGALAARRIVLADDGVIRATAFAVRRLVRHPVRSLAAFAVPLLALVAVVAPIAAATSVAWDAVRASFSSGSSPIVAVALVALLVVLWTGGLVLVGLVTAWRSAVWTADVAGTFGGVTGARPGDWRPADPSANLGDLRPRGSDPDAR